MSKPKEIDFFQQDMYRHREYIKYRMIFMMYPYDLVAESKEQWKQVFTMMDAYNRLYEDLTGDENLPFDTAPRTKAKLRELKIEDFDVWMQEEL